MKEQAKRNYEEYHFSGKEVLVCLGQSLFLCLAADYLFYESVWALIPLAAFPILYLKWKKKDCIRQRKKKLKIMHDTGVLSDEEFCAEKNRILNEL